MCGTGQNSVMVAGGMESMSNVPYYLARSPNIFFLGFKKNL
jgi:acetyl-CoA acetyltransferase